MGDENKKRKAPQGDAESGKRSKVNHVTLAFVSQRTNNITTGQEAMANAAQERGNRKTAQHLAWRQRNLGYL